MNTLPNDCELRCRCGSLMARVTDRGVELKCRRCKRVVVIATDRTRGWVPVEMHTEVKAMRDAR